jgi:ribonucleoside-diphosphate reductase alpha chain
MAEPVVIDPPGKEPDLTGNALAVLRNRYLQKNPKGKCIETPGQLFSRVAKFVARAESKYGASRRQRGDWHRKFYELMASLRFLPNSPALMNAYRPRPMLSACFVLPVEDSIEGIFEAIKQTALIQKAGGGTGFSFDRLRPTGDRVASSGGTTSGPISFWRVFSEATNAIQQGAYRRGANMGAMSVDHPDILKFLYAKQNLSAFTNFNVSVKITDEWMHTLRHRPNSFAVVKNPRTGEQYLLPRGLKMDTYTIDDLCRVTGASVPRRGRFYTVRDLWKTIIRCAHRTGEPGLIFIDRVNEANPTPSLGQIEATNPCGEQPLLPYEACTLGSVNLSMFTGGDGPARVDWQGLAETIELAVRFLDNIVDVCDYPVAQIGRVSRGNRKIGLGVMGFADCLFKLNIPYDSQEGVAFGAKLMAFVNEKAHEASGRLAEERGVFPNWSASTWRTSANLRMRNAAVTCIAPTGTISIIADCSCGIEPVYSLVFVRQVLGGAKLLQVNPVFRQTARKMGLYSRELERNIAKSGSIRQLKQIPARVRRVFKGAYDINPVWHVRMQVAFQKSCDAAVSKTVNFPENAPAAAVQRAYKLAYELGCKGITIYRQRSRPEQPMTLD